MVIFRIIRKIIVYATGRKEGTKLYEGYVQLKGQEANDYISNIIKSQKPIMVAKFGTIELNALVSHLCNKQKSYNLKDYIDYFRGEKPTLWWKIKLDSLCSNAGFFPNDCSLLAQFYQVYHQGIKNIDVLGSYIYNEKYFSQDLVNSVKVNLNGYYAPFLYKQPWTKNLEGRKVLVIHPFIDEIKSQYENRENIWSDPDVLPNFELLTYKPIVSMLDNKTEFKTWFEALEKMQNDIKKMDFDVAIIGCGAYGLPLASFIKDLGKQSIHLAGWTQVLFGIKGKRWDDLPQISRFYNEHWVRPGQKTKIEGFSKVEDGCYW
ncbi:MULTISPECIES: hypothetical protein [Klebsiella]|uniref:hypothetical protein n=1 Tax=Klebsiella TaxID=570 RepID=UPI0007D0C798|nr:MULTISPECIES: hypothetical protein [Klebsiella]PJX42555.1 hypothetical protein CWM62_14545 [Klebsiella sp. C-Nf10]PJX52258.1 hypothetical protein CWM54_16855 [Klebsiella sp. D-Nf1]SBN32775.1 conserved hypothetical protein [Klebsiella variicola]